MCSYVRQSLWGGGDLKFTLLPSPKKGKNIGPKFYKYVLSFVVVWKPWGLLLNLNWNVQSSSVKIFTSLILIYGRGNFVSHIWMCTLIYRPLSSPPSPSPNTRNNIKTSIEKMWHFFNKDIKTPIELKRKYLKVKMTGFLYNLYLK